MGMGKRVVAYYPTVFSLLLLDSKHILSYTVTQLRSVDIKGFFL